jgi:hypothetical protein
MMGAHHARNVGHVVVVDRIRIIDREPKVPVLCVGLLRIVPFHVTLAGLSAVCDAQTRALTVCQ